MLKSGLASKKFYLQTNNYEINRFADLSGFNRFQKRHLMSLIDFDKPIQCFTANALLCSFEVLTAMKAYKMLMYIYYTTKQKTQHDYEKYDFYLKKNLVSKPSKTIEIRDSSKEYCSIANVLNLSHL